jgi:hypothetical protein
MVRARDEGGGQESTVRIRELTMMAAIEVAPRGSARHELRAVARETGLDGKAARRYVEALQTLGVSAEVTHNDALVHAITQRVQAGPEAAQCRRGRRPERVWGQSPSPRSTSGRGGR